MLKIRPKVKLVKKHFSLAVKQEQQSFVQFVLDDLKGADLPSQQFDPDFHRYLAELIENQFKKGENDEKVDKMVIFIDLMKALYTNITPKEVDAIKKSVEFLLREKKVKKVKLTSVMSKYITDRFFSSQDHE